MTTRNVRIYTTLDVNNKETRLLAFTKCFSPDQPGSLSCSLVKTPLDKAPNYSAISYVWGERPYSYQSINIDGVDVAFPAKAEEALRYLHGQALSSVQDDSGTAYLWIDAVCIDQQNDTERAQQVAIMSEIYSKAVKVMVFLGPVLVLSGDEVVSPRDMAMHRKLWTMELRQTVQMLREEFKSRHALTGGLDIHTALPTADLFGHINKADLIQYFSSPWFARHWIIQEVALSQRAEAIYGSDVGIPLIDILVLARWLKKIHIRNWIPGANSAFLDSLYGCTTLYWTRTSSFCKHKLAHDGLECRKDLCYDNLPLWWLLQATFGSRTTDMRDKVYGLLGLCSADVVDEVRPDYSKSLSRVYADAARASFLETKSFDLLTYSRLLGNRPDSWYVENQWPTWVPLLQELDGSPEPTELPMTIYNASASLDADISTEAFMGGQLPVLRCRGVIVDKISYISPTRQRGRTPRDAESGEEWSTCIQLAAQCDRIGRDESPLQALAFTMAAGYLPIDLDPTTLNEQILLDVLTSKIPGQDAENELTLYTLHRRIFFTQQGYMGLGSQYVEEGDTVVVPFGSRLPWILREAEDGVSRFVGVCYLHTIMHGEFMNALIVSGQLAREAKTLNVV